jgi:hypothetical protein
VRKLAWEVEDDVNFSTKESFLLKINQAPEAPIAVHILGAMNSQIMKYDIIDIFVNCNWVDTQWQQYSTHLRSNSTQNNTTTLVGRLSGIRTQSGQTKINDDLTT